MLLYTTIFEIISHGQIQRQNAIVLVDIQLFFSYTSLRILDRKEIHMTDYNNSKRITFDILSRYRGVLMGIATLCILIFHYTDDCRMAEYNFKGLNYFINYYISSSGVDVFLVVSGLGLYYSFSKNNKLSTFFKKRVTKIIIPYLVIAGPALIWSNFVFNHFTLGRFIQDITFVTLFTKGITWYWYILISLICYIIFPKLFSFFAEAKDKSTEQIRLLALITLSLVISVMISEYDNSLFGNINILLLRFPSFFFGVYLGKLSYEKRPLNAYDFFLFVLIALAVFSLRFTHRVIFVRYALALINYLAYFAIIVAMDFLKNSKLIGLIKKCLEKVGEYSIELYLTHVTVRSIFNAYKLSTYRVRYYAMVVIISVVLSIIVKIISSFISKKILHDR